MRPYQCTLEYAPEGWRDLVAPLIKQAEAEGATILQIKEKFGGLRFYYDGGSEKLHAAVTKAEEQSYKLCQVCGAPGKLSSTNGWLATLCPEHYEKYNAT